MRNGIPRNQLLSFPTSLVAVLGHEDDEIIGSGGTLAKNIRLGGKSHVICAGGKREKELEDACGILGVSYDVLGLEHDSYRMNLFDKVPYIKESIIERKPSFVITHRAEGDYHLDHGATYDVAKLAATKAQFPAHGWNTYGLLLTETHSPHHIWHMMVDVSKDYDKVFSAFNVHSSQMEKNDFYYKKLCDARTKFRGVQAGCERAEAFVFEPLSIVGSMNKRNLGA
jgi:LmbE family N-acetylglucosaminyl deacetylase